MAALEYGVPEDRSGVFTRTGLQLSELGLGCYPFTDHWHGEALSDQNIVEFIHLAISNGINVIDTSEMHANGRIESLVGRAIKDRRDEVAIVTKGGFMQRFLDGSSYWEIDASANNLRRAIDGSLQRLNVDYIDYYLSHFPDPRTPLEETLGVLEQAQRAGKIVEFGFSNYTASTVERALELAPGLGALQYHYSLLDRNIEGSIMSMSRRNNILLMVYRVLERGLLTGVLPEVHDVARNRYTMFQEPWLSEITKKVAVLKDIANAYGRTPAQVALRWALSHP
ncbi:MAG TPA: aldo/keto reductase, partial [Candidatus Saccharimonadales bacterium]|nr:aldo/keto reductase [Candidatus Saccharimonadales bacterium]